ncbi:hypothetical protein ACFLXB_03650 [Chloroflexota bacterium]
MTLPVIITISFLVISKLMDVLSTLGRIRSVNAESNPIARGLMQKIGIRKTIWLIFIISLTIIMVTGYMALSSGLLLQVLFVFLGIIISAVQFSVAHSNWSGKGNLITSYFLRFHDFINRIIKT